MKSSILSLSMNEESGNVPQSAIEVVDGLAKGLYLMGCSSLVYISLGLLWGFCCFGCLLTLFAWGYNTLEPLLSFPFWSPPKVVFPFF